MISRRRFAALPAAALVPPLAAPALLAGGRVSAQALVRTSYGPTTTDISTGHAGHTSLPATLGYWRNEGLDVNVFGIAGSTMGVQLLSAGHVDFVGLSGEDILAARARGIPIRSVYLHARQPISRIVVPADSGITAIAQLRGKTLGVPVLGPDPYATGAFAEAGLDLEKDVTRVAVGTGAPALLALRRGDVAGYLAWDTAVAGLEVRGMRFTEFRPSYYDELFGLCVATRDEVVEKRPDLVVGMCRGIAEGVTFGMANPEAAIRIHWQAYPQSRPQGGDEAKLLQDAKHVFMSRFVLYALEPGARFGESRPAQWERVAGMMRAAGRLPADPDLAAAYTNRFVPAVNAFDADAVRARAVRYPQP
ncbi:ABC transporter substrate-binding protein [Roseomonas sp. NAR14]|uniref:ABC transporter substrate-binding protein n=1 Tax=Roseomonas acroporae TaxID=2937791 RepID=A0A9X1Y2L7_9PROT|nr:ABC transporter substrate-binding protein [Roseomonas acroporae]MCK8783004.1 ABC transporter substrate-binding protein [Roseomonas acroporae]